MYIVANAFGIALDFTSVHISNVGQVHFTPWVRPSKNVLTLRPLQGTFCCVPAQRGRIVWLVKILGATVHISNVPAPPSFLWVSPSTQSSGLALNEGGPAVSLPTEPTRPRCVACLVLKGSGTRWRAAQSAFAQPFCA